MSEERCPICFRYNFAKVLSRYKNIEIWYCKCGYYKIVDKETICHICKKEILEKNSHKVQLFDFKPEVNICDSCYKNNGGI
jgi:hypothetical protein